MELNKLFSAPAARKHKRKTLGRGHGSGLGKTSGRGQKGQKARKSGRTRPGFEGGQTPLYRRLPKFGFDNTKFNPGFVAISLKRLSRYDGTTITRKTLVELGLLSGKSSLPVKIIGGCELKKALVIEAQQFSAGAKKLITAAGGQAVELSLRDAKHAFKQQAAAKA